MVFRDGGAFDFHSNFERIKERLQQALEVVRDSGQVVGDGSDTGGGQGGGALSGLHMAAMDLEQLPAYEEAGTTLPVIIPTVSLSSPVPPLEPQPRESETGMSSDGESVRIADDQEGDMETAIAPAEPPPGYEEVQRSSVANELERALQAEH